MALASYVRGRIDVTTPLDVSKCKGVVLSIRQPTTKIDITKYSTTGEFGVFRFELSPTDAAKLQSGKCEVQMRGFASGEEFYTAVFSLPVDRILYREVLNAN